MVPLESRASKSRRRRQPIHEAMADAPPQPPAGEKKKKVRPGPPPAPVGIATAAVVARVAAARVFGLWPGAAMAGLQPTWTGEPGTDG